MNRRFPKKKRCFLKTTKTTEHTLYCMCVFVFSWNNIDSGARQYIRYGMFCSGAAATFLTLITLLSQSAWWEKGGRLPYLDILAVCSEICPSRRLCPAILFWLGLNLVGGVGLSDVDLVTGCVCVRERFHLFQCKINNIRACCSMSHSAEKHWRDTETLTVSRNPAQGAGNAGASHCPANMRMRW